MLTTSWLKVLSFLGVWAIVWLPIALGIFRSIDWRSGKVLLPQQKLVLLGSLYVLCPIVLGWKIKAENLSFDSLGLTFQTQTPLSIISGLALGLLSLIIIFVLESVLGLITWHWSNRSKLFASILPILVLSLLISLVEEAVFRGYIFEIFRQEYSAIVAAILSGFIFALLHLVWERKETIPQIPGLWLMGLVLVGAKILDNNSIYLAVGLHGGWIWGLTCLDSSELLSYRSANSWLTGLNQKPLAGVAGIFCLILVGAILWLILERNYIFPVFS